MNLEMFKGYVVTDGKVALEPYKYKTAEELHSYETICRLPDFAGVIDDGYVLVDLDSEKEANILLKIVKGLKLKTVVFRTNRGMHFYFKVSDRTVTNKTGTSTACGLTVDMKLGSRNGLGIVSQNGKVREIIYQTDTIQTIPQWLTPVKHTFPFMHMGEGDGRNQALFEYILTLQTIEFSKDEVRETLQVINDYILDEPLPAGELDIIMRDEAFEMPMFFGGKNGNKFLFDKFAKYLVSEHNLIKINNQLHIYRDGIYANDIGDIEHQMIKYIPNLRQAQRTEVMKYIDVLIRDSTEASPANFIAFNNGIYNIITGELIPFSEDFIMTNRIPWDYNPNAYSEVADKTLDKLSCNDYEIRALMEEMIGYTFYRRNELGKAFILTGDKSNGKSTFLDMISRLLGIDNISALDLSEIGDRFKTAELFGKLANIGDDIGNEFIADTSVFKKVTTGDLITVEKKGEDPFKFSNYSKLIFSANEIPRMSDSTGAVLRRLVIIPFNAKFSSSDPDFDPYIKYKLRDQEVMEYLIILGLAGLKRVLENNRFTDSAKVDDEIREYNLQNNPVELFFNELDVERDVINQTTSAVYGRYLGFCTMNNIRPMSRIRFTRAIGDKFSVESRQTRVDGKAEYMFRRI